MTQVRPATPADVPRIVKMVHQLAEYERAADDCRLTEGQLHSALFADRPAIFCNVAETAAQPQSEQSGAQPPPGVGGFALWFLNFSTWHGTHGIYLEDLFVDPAMRGRGLGKALLCELARVCVERGYRRLEWSVLDWNEPALRFYRTLGAVPMDEWTVHRVTGEALQRLAAGTSYPARTAAMMRGGR